MRNSSNCKDNVSEKNFGQIMCLLINQSMSIKVRMRVDIYGGYIWPMLICGCKAWTVNNEIQNFD